MAVILSNQSREDYLSNDRIKNVEYTIFEDFISVSSPNTVFIQCNFEVDFIDKEVIHELIKELKSKAKKSGKVSLHGIDNLQNRADSLFDSYEFNYNTLRILFVHTIIPMVEKLRSEGLRYGYNEDSLFLTIKDMIERFKTFSAGTFSEYLTIYRDLKHILEVESLEWFKDDAIDFNYNFK